MQLKFKDPNEGKSASTPEKEEEQAVQKTKIKITLSVLGDDVRELELDSGTTLGDVIKAQKLDRMEIRVNAEEVENGKELQDDDVIVAVPDSVVGGSK